MLLRLKAVPRLSLTCLVWLFLILAYVKAQARDSYKPKDGFVPNSETAIAIAEAVLKPIYGVDKINSERPFTSEFKDGVWVVSGSLQRGTSNVAVKGGVAMIEISKADGRILRVSHGK